MTLSSLRSAKCSGLSEGERLLRESYDTVPTVGTVSAPYTAKKLRTVKKVPYEVYAVRRKQNMTMNRKIAKLYRTAYSTYRPYGIILRKIILCCRVDKGFDAHKAAHPAATGQINVVSRFEIQPDSVLADL